MSFETGTYTVSAKADPGESSGEVAARVLRGAALWQTDHPDHLIMGIKYSVREEPRPGHHQDSSTPEGRLLGAIFADTFADLTISYEIETSDPEPLPLGTKELADAWYAEAQFYDRQAKQLPYLAKQAAAARARAGALRRCAVTLNAARVAHKAAGKETF